MQEFKINEFLSLRLEDEDTMIYVARARFMQCAFLLLNISIEELSSFDEIESVDEAVEKLDISIENHTKGYELGIPPETEFWGHCSNLQVWHEHDYDTRLIHSNLAFPLLRKLTEVGDPLAKRVFREEIIKRYEEGTNTTREFLEIEKFLDFLPIDERLHLLLNNDSLTALLDLSLEILPSVIAGAKIKYPVKQFLYNLIESGDVKIANRQVVELKLWKLKLDVFPKSILKIVTLKVLDLRNNNLKEIPQNIDRLLSLTKLLLSNNNITDLPDSICNLKNLERLSLGNNKIKRLPKNIGDLTQLKALWLPANSLERLPESICKFKKIEVLLLSNNLLKELPIHIGPKNAIIRLFSFNLSWMGLVLNCNMRTGFFSMHLGLILNGRRKRGTSFYIIPPYSSLILI